MMMKILVVRKLSSRVRREMNEKSFERAKSGCFEDMKNNSLAPGHTSKQFRYLCIKIIIIKIIYFIHLS